MGDYLWDKSGERDEDVERLEELLGGLRYQPRPLELPVEMSVRESRRRLFWFAYAAAAALALTAFAGLWLGVLREPSQKQNSASVTSGAAQAPGRPIPEKMLGETTAPSTEVEAAVQPKQLPNKQVAANRLDRNHFHKNHRRLFVERRLVPRPNNRVSEPELNRQEVATAKAIPGANRATNQNTEVGRRVGEQQMAKEQLMLALRLASANLNFVQRKTQETHDVKPALDE